MSEELEQLLKNLKLRRILEIYDEQLEAANKDDISYTEWLTRLVRAQWQAKQEGALEWQGGEHRVRGRNRKRQERTGLRSAAEGLGERLPLPVYQGPGLVR